VGVNFAGVIVRVPYWPAKESGIEPVKR